MSSPDVHPLAPYGLDDRVTALVERFGRPGRVVRVEYGACQTVLAAGDAVEEVQATWTSATSRQAGIVESPVVGDWVDVGAGSGDGPVVVGLAPRWSSLRRHDPAEGHSEQVLAANVDRIFVVAAADQPVNQRRLDRLLTVAWDSGAVPTVVLTKPDLADDLAAREAEASAVAGAADVLVVDGLHHVGLDALRGALAGGTAVFLGPSGVGKSTLVNALAGEAVQATGEVREGDRKGRHTTTSRELVVVPTGGVVIDTPGIRAVQLWDAADGLAQQFADIEALAEGCRFRDCAHESEPGCAVLEAVDTGDLGVDRLESWRLLKAELAAWEVRREDAARRSGSRRDPGIQRQIRPRRR